MLVAHYSAALLFMTAGAVFAGLGAAGVYGGGRWLPLHLVLVGGVSQLVIASAQFFAAAFFATDLPTRRRVRGQLVLWNTGALLLVIGVYYSEHALADAGATLLAVAVGLVLSGLVRMQRVSLQQRRVMVRWYYTCLAFFLAGMFVGLPLARGVAWTHGDLLATHLALMLGGWLGTAIVGTLHTFYPSITKTRLAYQRLEPPTYWAWIAGVVTLTVGYAFALAWLAIAGWLLLIAGASLLLTNVVATGRSGSLDDAPALFVSAGQACLIAGLALATVSAIVNPDATLTTEQRAAVGTLLLFGWIAMTVLGSLVRLLTVVGRVRNLALDPPRVGLHPAVVAVATAGTGCLALAQLTGNRTLWMVSVVALTADYAITGMRVGALALRAVRAARIEL